MAQYLCEFAQVDWGDLRYFLALARAGSLSSAARELGAEHSTVARRVSALEGSLGVRLFDRGPRGYSLTPEGERIAELALRVEGEVFGIERLAQAGDGEMRGTVRIAAPPSFASAYLTPRLAALRTTQPGIQIELAGDTQAVSLTRREADIAVRLARPEPSSIVARRVGAMAHGLYGARTYLARTAPGQRDYLGYDESLDHVPQQRWLLGLAAGRPLVFRTNELASLQPAVAAGMGLAALPRFMGDADPALERLPLDARPALRELWLLVHPDLRRSPRVRAVLDHIGAQILADRRLLDPDGDGG